MVSFRDIDIESADEVGCLVRWANDPSIRHLFLRFESKAAYETPLAFASAQRNLRESLNEGRLLHLILDEEGIVGEVSLDMDSKNLHTPAPNTAWFGIVIGEERARGHGYGRQAMIHVEELARGLGAERAEIGVFEYNERAQQLYHSLGYREISRIPDFTYWKGERWTDIRMSKAL